MGVCRHCGLEKDIFPFQQLFSGWKSDQFSRDIAKKREKTPPPWGLGCREGRLLEGGLYWGFYGRLDFGKFHLRSLMFMFYLFGQPPPNYNLFDMQQLWHVILPYPFAHTGWTRIIARGKRKTIINKLGSSHYILLMTSPPYVLELCPTRKK